MNPSSWLWPLPTSLKAVRITTRIRIFSNSLASPFLVVFYKAFPHYLHIQTLLALLPHHSQLNNEGSKAIWWIRFHSCMSSQSKIKITYLVYNNFKCHQSSTLYLKRCWLGINLICTTRDNNYSKYFPFKLPTAY